MEAGGTASRLGTQREGFGEQSSLFGDEFECCRKLFAVYSSNLYAALSYLFGGSCKAELHSDVKAPCKTFCAHADVRKMLTDATMRE